MQIRLALLMVMLLSMPLAGCQDQGQSSGPGIAVVDIARVMRDSVPGKEGVKFLEGRQAELQSALDAIQDGVEKNPDDEKAVQQLQQEFAAAQQRMQAEQQNVVNILFDAVQRVVNEYRQKEGYAVILGSDAVASFAPQSDVTNAVIAEVDKLKLEFKPLPQARLPQKNEDVQASEPAAAEGGIAGEKSPDESAGDAEKPAESASSGEKDGPAKK